MAEFLLARGVRWDQATAADVEAFKFWRRTDDRNPLRVQGSTFGGDVAALCALYDWTGHRFGVANPIDKRSVVRDGVARAVADVRPDYVRAADVKWLAPDAYRRWRDVGVLGLLPDGGERARWRPRCEQRELAFVEGLWGTGLRLQEWASVLALELPADDPSRGFYTCRLADACAKGGRGRRYWMPRRALTGVLVETEQGLERARDGPVSRSAALPAPGYEPPARLIDEGERLVVRFYPEGGGTSHDFDLSGLAVPAPLRRSLAEAFVTVTGPAGTRRTQVSAATLLQDVRLFVDVLAEVRRPPRTVAQLTPAHLDVFRLRCGINHAQRASSLKTLFRAVPDVPAGFAARDEHAG